MHNRNFSIILTGLIFLLVLLLAGCHPTAPQETPTASISPTLSTFVGSPTPEPTESVPYPLPTEPVSSIPTLPPYPNAPETSTPTQAGASPSTYPGPEFSATPQPTQEVQATQVQPSQTSTPTLTPTLVPTATPTATATSESQYPGPEASATTYPGPYETPTTYPGPAETNTPPSTSPQPTTTASSTPTEKTPTPKSSGTPSRSASPTIPAFGTGTPATTPTEIPPRHPLSPPPAGSHIDIWLSWSQPEIDVLQDIIQSFQRLYPDVTISLQDIPLDDLLASYQEAAYLGHGPSLLFGPAEWGQELFTGQLIEDLLPYIPANYLAGINSAALASGRDHDALISLPLSQHGVVMYRNTAVIATAPYTFDELIQLSREATRAGTVGSYLERGAYFSSASLLGLGGSLMNDAFQPQFDDSMGEKWLGLLSAFHDAGAVTFNTNRDLDMFKRGRVGLIIDGTWNMQPIIDAIGSDKLAIDPWPTYDGGHLSGWVDADSVFLNDSITGNDRFAALAFIGYLLDSQVQMRLAEVGHIPSVAATTPRNPLLQQAMQAFSSGVSYPITVDNRILSLYWDELNSAIADVFIRGVGPQSALRTARQDLSLILLNSTPAP